MANFDVVQTSETEIEEKYRRWAESQGLMIVKLNITGRRGMPDRMILGNEGDVLFLEFKRPGRKAEKLQLYMQKLLLGRGFMAFIVDSFEDAKCLTERYILGGRE